MVVMSNAAIIEGDASLVVASRETGALGAARSVKAIKPKRFDGVNTYHFDQHKAQSTDTKSENGHDTRARRCGRQMRFPARETSSARAERSRTRVALGTPRAENEADETSSFSATISSTNAVRPTRNDACRGRWRCIADSVKSLRVIGAGHTRRLVVYCRKSVSARRYADRRTVGHGRRPLPEWLRQSKR